MDSLRFTEISSLSKDMDSRMFLKLGNIYTRSKVTREKSALRRFKSFFGVTPIVCSIVWNAIKNKAPSGAQPKHLLWCLSFLKEYTSEHNRRSIFKAGEKTIRDWTWTFVKLLRDFDVIRWERRFDGAVNGQTCFCSLDGLDLKILEPSIFSPKWFSHKFRGPGVRYEIVLNIRTGDVLSVNRGELTMADKGYNDALFFIPKTARNYVDHGIIMARHETVNKRIRQFNILKHTYRHSLRKHPSVFHAVVNLTQLMIENGHPLFSVLN